MLPQEWEQRLVDVNVRGLRDQDLAWADVVFISGMKWGRQLSPVMQALEGPDPETALPMAATKALQVISS